MPWLWILYTRITKFFNCESPLLFMYFRVFDSFHSREFWNSSLYLHLGFSECLLHLPVKGYLFSLVPSFPTGRKRQDGLGKSHRFPEKWKNSNDSIHAGFYYQIRERLSQVITKDNPLRIFPYTLLNWHEAKKKKKKDGRRCRNTVVPEKSYCLQKPYQFTLFILSPQATFQESKLGNAQAVGGCVSKANFSICIKFSISGAAIKYHATCESSLRDCILTSCLVFNETKNCICHLPCLLDSFDPSFDPTNVSLSASSNFTCCSCSS